MRKKLAMLFADEMEVSPLSETACETEASGACGADMTWSYGSGTLTIQGTGSMENYCGRDAAAPWHDYREQIHTVKIGGGITAIGDSAFEGCGSLTGAIIPDGVAAIGGSAFFMCGGLTGVTIPDSVTTIGWLAFSGCGSLTDVYYGGSESQWKQIIVEGWNEPLTDAAIHYNSAASSTGVPG